MKTQEQFQQQSAGLITGKDAMFRKTQEQFQKQSTGLITGEDAMFMEM